MYHPPAGTRHHHVPLEPPQMFEFLTIEDREAAAKTESGRAVLACEARGYGLFRWCVLVDDLEAVAARLGLAVDDYTVPHGHGTLRGWRTAGGPAHLPFFIDYARNGDRAARLRAVYDGVAHASAPTHFAELTISGSADEHRAWLGEHGLPLRFVAGPRGVVEARIALRDGEAVLR